MRPNINKFAELIEDVTLHPSTMRTIESHWTVFNGSHDPELTAVDTATSKLTGEKIGHWKSMGQSSDDLTTSGKIRRQNYRRPGTCTREYVGWTAQIALCTVTEDIDQLPD